MKLSEALAPAVPRMIRERGYQYYRQGRAIVLARTGDSVEVMVQGSRPYSVSLVMEDAGLAAYCDCPDDRHLTCKHGWAALLEAESEGYFQTAAPPPQEKPQFPVPPPAPKRITPKWHKQLDEIEGSESLRAPASEWPARRHIFYEISAEGFSTSDHLQISMYMRERNAKDTDWNQRKDLRITRSEIAALPEPLDQEILLMLGGASSSWYLANEPVNSRVRAVWPLTGRLMPLLCRTGRCTLLTRQERNPESLRWSSDDPWHFELYMDAHRDQVAIEGYFTRGEARIGVRDPSLVVPGLVFIHGEAAFLDPHAPFEWIRYLRQSGAVIAPREDADLLLARILEAEKPPALRVPESLRFESTSPDPGFRLHISGDAAAGSQLKAVPHFEYDGQRVTPGSSARPQFDPQKRVLFRRNPEAERRALEQLEEAGVKPPIGGKENWRIPARSLPTAVRKLIQNGWHVEAEGRLFRSPRGSSVRVSSTLDWFELHGEIEYEGTSASLPAILDAIRRGDRVVQLGDGSFGLLPEEWLAQFTTLAQFGEHTGTEVRFGRHQALLLDALLAVQPQVSFDEDFARARAQLASFEGIRAAEQPPGFVGSLRDYQREGLGWMEFLREFGFGGCLADDMGVGKTAQVLAMLETRRAAGFGPSLVVVPRSLIFNWKQEAEKFTPRLRILDHTGAERDVAGLSEHDLVLTTYGTLRRDIVELRNIPFDYVILDEAQAIRNAATDSAKATRLLQGKHKLALTGTPVENRLSDLWSIFEFLNPGLLGTGRAFDALAATARSQNPESRQLLGQVLRPLILRRTKEQVARELPDKSEQTIVCELEGPQRKIYNELRDYYRASLLKRIDSDGLAKSKMHVLEALLRLRQAACHPGLLDAGRRADPSAKVDLLLDRLAEVVEEGHKALVFSQFTSLLSIVRERLDHDKVEYEYLDGKTRDRQARVERFQNDPDCRLFLISLKAGGLGLNLTAADYVFLLDPWWNPAVEAQAIDRAHRIGQTQHVFAYRLIAKDTVEEKVLELQNTKRDLAAAIIGEENRMLASLAREDLEILLS